MDRCKNNPKKSFTTKVGEHILSGFSMSVILSFNNIKMSMMYTEIDIA